MDPIFSTLPKEICERYKDTRYLPERTCLALFNIIKNRTGTVLDVGSGTGRIALPLAKHFKGLQITGIDVSEDMVEFASEQAKKVGVAPEKLTFQRSELFSFAHDPNHHSAKYDFVLSHWCLHCVRPWRSALLASICLTKPEGHLFWLDEDSSLYRALDNVEEENDHWWIDEKPWHEFWVRFHELRSTLEPRSSAQNRTGTTIRAYDQIKEFLHCLGWTVSNKDSKEWTKEWSYRWILDECLEPQSFTSLQRLQHDKYEDMIVRLRNSLEETEMPLAEDKVEVKYTATLCQASPEPGSTSIESVQKNIFDCMEHVYHEVLDLCFIAGVHPDKAIKVLKGVLATFFSALYEPDSLPAWKEFWRPDPNQDPVTPNWVWIRFSDGPAPNLEDFLQSHRLWSHDDDNYLSSKILSAYFNTNATFAEFVHSSEKDVWRPVCIWVREESAQFTVELWKQMAVEIQVPADFVTGSDAYCPDLPDPDNFDEALWTNSCKDNLDTLFLPDVGTDPLTKPARWRKQLRKFGRDLDRILGVDVYAQQPELFVKTLHAMRLFPGNCYYLFPVRDVHGDFVSSVSFGMNYHLDEIQVRIIHGCIERLLTVPSLVVGLLTKLRHTGETATNEAEKTRSNIA